jgi:predicted DCC family thiol-disulfide oxidoreductase YuxK
VAQLEHRAGGPELHLGLPSLSQRLALDHRVEAACRHNGVMANDAPTDAVETNADAPGDAAAPPEPARPVFLFDGDCAFCTTCAEFVERRIPADAAVTPWQFADLDVLGVRQADAEEAVIWVAPDGSTAAGPDAIARLLVSAGSCWRPLGWALGAAPVRWLAWPVYRWLARNRHRMPGGTPACSLPQADRERRAAG